jgi:hypothetical protein
LRSGSLILLSDEQLSFDVFIWIYNPDNVQWTMNSEQWTIVQCTVYSLVEYIIVPNIIVPNLGTIPLRSCSSVVSFCLLRTIFKTVSYPRSLKGS